jgi:hypothetical protein
MRHRTTRTQTGISHPTFLGLAFTLAQATAKTWRRIGHPRRSLTDSAIHVIKRYPVTDDPPDEHRGAACTIPDPKVIDQN